MDATNQDVLRQLHELAQAYFAAIVEANSIDGECSLKPGKYSAKEMADNNFPCGKYLLPSDDFFEEVVTIESGTFRCSFPYRRIFTILAEWEAMSRAGKLKAVFEIGEAEEKSARILIDEKTELGAYKTKGMKVQRVSGNWWMPRKLPKNGDVALFYELNGVMFIPGLRFSDDRIKKHRNEVEERCAKLDDAEMTKMLLSYLARYAMESEYIRSYGYFEEVARRAGVDTTSEEAVAVMEAAKEEQHKRDEQEARKAAERNARAEEARRARLEEEERIRQRMAEKLTEAKGNFISGKMISEEDFEAIAASVGYEINIRTLGTLHKRVESVWMDENGYPSVRCSGRGSGLDGTYEAIREVYERVKYAVQATETPRESMEAERTANVSAEAQNEPPQSPTTPSSKETISSGAKQPQTAQNEPKRAVKAFLIVQHPARHVAHVRNMIVPRLVRSVPRGCLTVVMPHRSPPIRGDCKRDRKKGQVFLSGV